MFRIAAEKAMSRARCFSSTVFEKTVVLYLLSWLGGNSQKGRFRFCSIWKPLNFFTGRGRKTSVWPSFYSSSWKRFEGLFLVEVTYVCLSFKHLLDLLVYQRLSSPFQFKLLFVFFSCLFSQLYITQLLLQIYCFLFPGLLPFCQAVFITVNIIKAK